MANKNVFGAATNQSPAATTTNLAGGLAYELSPKATLSQLAATNCFNGTYYANSQDTYEMAKRAVYALREDQEFIAKTAIYCRDKAYMKDMPAYLCAVLACQPNGDRELFRKTFRRVIDNGKMLRTFVQIARSGMAGKVLNLSSGSVRRAIQDWFDARSPQAIFRASVGNDPSLADVIRMARPRPEPNSEKSALLSYLTGKPLDPETKCFQYSRKAKDGTLAIVYSDPWDNLPSVVREYEAYKLNPDGTPPDVDFNMLTNLPLGASQWKEIARNANWTMTRMNLETFQRHGVFDDASMISLIADRLRNPALIANSRVFPYQLLMAYRASTNVPQAIREALQDAIEHAVANTPAIDGDVYVAVDTSGSMSSAVTGYRVGATTSVRCVDVASLFAACLARKNPLTRIYPFDSRVHSKTGHDCVNPRDSIMTIATQLAKYGGGGTDCSVVLKHLNQQSVKNARSVIYVSDNESWIDTRSQSYSTRSTSMMEEWVKFRKNNKNAKLVCIDITPNTTSQASRDRNILNVGGFGDQVFDVIANFLKEDAADPEHWVKVIEAVEI